MCFLIVIRTWSGLVNPGLTLANNPSDSYAETHLKWLDGSAYNASVEGFRGDMGPFCHRRGTHGYTAISCNQTKEIICQFDCSNLNEGRSGKLEIKSLDSQQPCNIFQFMSVPMACKSPHPDTFPYLGNITRLTQTIRRIFMGLLRSARRSRVPFWNSGRIMNLRLQRSC